MWFIHHIVFSHQYLFFHTNRRTSGLGRETRRPILNLNIASSGKFNNEIYLQNPNTFGASSQFSSALTYICASDVMFTLAIRSCSCGTRCSHAGFSLVLDGVRIHLRWEKNLTHNFINPNMIWSYYLLFRGERRILIDSRVVAFGDRLFRGIVQEASHFVYNIFHQSLLNCTKSNAVKWSSEIKCLIRVHHECIFKIVAQH